MHADSVCTGNDFIATGQQYRQTGPDIHTHTHTGETRVGSEKNVEKKGLVQ